MMLLTTEVSKPLKDGWLPIAVLHEETLTHHVAIDKLCAFLESNGSELRGLDLSNMQLTADDLARIAPRLTFQYCDSLMRLYLADNPLSDDSMQTIAKILANSRSIYDIDISNINITEEGCFAFNHALEGDMLKLGRINVSNNKIGDAGFHALFARFNFTYNHAHQFPALHFNRCELTDDAISALNTAFDRFCYWRMSFNENAFSTLTAERFYQEIDGHNKIVELSLCSTLPTIEPKLKLLQAALYGKLSLLTLDEFTLNFKQRGIFAESPGRSTSLFSPRSPREQLVNQFTLAVSNLEVTREAIEHFAEKELLTPNSARSKNSTVPILWKFTELTFESCQFDLDCLDALATLVQKKSVSKLVFKKCSFPKGIKWVETLFSQRFCCTHTLVMDNCNIDDSVVAAISPRLKLMPDLDCVSLQSNLLTPRSIKRLQRWVNEQRCTQLLLAGNQLERSQFETTLMAEQDDATPLTLLSPRDQPHRPSLPSLKFGLSQISRPRNPSPRSPSKRTPSPKSPKQLFSPRDGKSSKKSPDNTEEQEQNKNKSRRFIWHPH